MIPVQYAVILSSALFAIGVYGLLTQRNALRILVAVELVLNAATLNFAAFSNHWGHMDGVVFALFIIALAAAEAAVGLAILIHMYRHAHSVDVLKASSLRW